MKFRLLLLFLVSLSIVLNAQKAQHPQKPAVYTTIDKVTLQIPDSLTHTTQDIAGYIKANFTTPTDRSRAIFAWVTANITYDIENMFAISFYQNTQEIVDKALKERKGICMHFAELFNDIALKTGLRSYVVTGYTKQNGFVDYIPHAWCAIFIDTTWCLFDPTWGSGSVINSKFIKKVNNYYFKTKPEQLIKSHMPFDPLWEFLNYPVTAQEFYEGKTQVNKQKIFFSYPDTLNKYESLSDIDKLITSSNRIEGNGVKNSIIFEKLEHNKREIEYYKNRKEVEEHNAASNMYNTALATSNQAISLLNVFIDYRNHKFNPKRSDNEVRQMVDTIINTYTMSLAQLQSIKSPDASITNLSGQLVKSIYDGINKAKDEKAFVEKYISTWKPLRDDLFYH